MHKTGRGIKAWVAMVLLAIPLHVLGQSTAADSAAAARQRDSMEHQKDIFDVAKWILGIRSSPSAEEAPRKGRAYVSVFPGVGYSLQNGLIGVISGNISFYTDTLPNANISSISFDINYTQRRQFYMPVISNIWTKGNGWDIQGDWRYYYYPSYTFGLGGHTSASNADLVSYKDARIHQVALKELLPDLLVGPGYSLDYYWDIRDMQTSKEGALLFQAYNQYRHSTTSSGITLNGLYDTRRNINNPRPGYYANVIYRNNLRLLGSTQNWQSLMVDLRKYIAFPARSNNILAFWNMYWLTLAGQPPYFDLPSTSWDTYENLGRGYIQGRFRGLNMLYLEAEYRFGIMRNGLLGGVVFSNVQTVSEWPSRRFETLYPAVGLGLRLKVNKRSNTNVAVDYGFGLGGSNGVFINLGEVF